MTEKHEPAKRESSNDDGKGHTPQEDAAGGKPSLLPSGNAIPDESHPPEKPPKTSAA